MPKLQRILQSINGVSSPIGGISWEHDESEKDIARKEMVFLNDRRVLYEPESVEVSSQCIASIQEIRKHTRDLMENIKNQDSLIFKYLDNICECCRVFLTKYQENEYHHILFVGKDLNGKQIAFLMGLNDYRRKMARIIKEISMKYKIKLPVHLQDLVASDINDFERWRKKPSVLQKDYLSR